MPSLSFSVRTPARLSGNIHLTCNVPRQLRPYDPGVPSKAANRCLTAP